MHSPSTPAIHPPHPPHHQPPAVHPPPPHIRDEDTSASPHTPFRQLYPFNNGAEHSMQRPHMSTKKTQAAPPSSTINKTKVVDPQKVIESHSSLICPSKISTLAMKLAKESFLGEEVMARCTVAGSISSTIYRAAASETHCSCCSPNIGDRIEICVEIMY